VHNRNHDNGSDDELDEAAVATAAMQAEEDASSQTMLYETMVPFTYDEADNLVEEEERLVMEPKYSRKRKVATPSGALMHGRAIKHEDGGYSSVPNIANLAEALTDIVIKDFRNVECLYDAGFSEFVRQAMGNSSPLPEPHKIESLLNEMHASKFLEIGEMTREFTSEKPFSLAFEQWINVEQRRFLSIYHHYLDEETQSARSMLYATVEYTDYIVFDDLLTDFYLANCTLAIINYEEDEDLLHTYLREKSKCSTRMG